MNTNTTIDITKASFDKHFLRNGTFNIEKHTYYQYMVSRDVFQQLCPKEYQDGKIHSDDTLALKADTNRLLAANKVTGDRLSLVWL